MSPDPRKARDLDLLDAIDAYRREPFVESVWRVTREERNPLQGARSRSRWCNDAFDVLYASLERDGAMAETYALFSSQPVFPSKIKSYVHRISVRASKMLMLTDMASLAKLGVDTSRYHERAYQRTQEIADAAYFLGFEGILAPSARWNCLSLALFATDRVAPEDIQLEQSEKDPIDWGAWKKTVSRGAT
ncbi:MAG: RES domain-containing protein [Alphaproteobacteria bacterium]|nr:RES domain-containing protein [Alphaproteobacteria bacterium]